LPKSRNIVPAGFGSLPKAGNIVLSGFGSLPKARNIVLSGFGSLPKGRNIVPASFGSLPKGKNIVPAALGVCPKGEIHFGLWEFAQRKKFILGFGQNFKPVSHQSHRKQKKATNNTGRFYTGTAKKPLLKKTSAEMGK
jgi:hypothetical protein